MEQEKLLRKAVELFEEQGFEIVVDGSRFTATNETEINAVVMSSSEYSLDDAERELRKGELVFVDDELSELDGRVENDVSILRGEEEEKDYDLPSFEIIGSVAVINELGDRAEDHVVEGILDSNPGVKTVLVKEEGLKGEFRVGEYRKIHGDETETVHTEHGCEYLVDPTRVYFSERFGTERERVVSQIEDGERVLVMFAGVGPFAIMAGKKADPSEVIAVEKNPDGADYLKKNIQRNKVDDRVQGIEGDVADVVPGLGKFDRIIMPLPESADEFLGLAFEHLNPGGVIHYYRFLEKEDWPVLEEEISGIAEETGVEFEIMERVICGHRGAYLDRVCIDIKKK